MVAELLFGLQQRTTDGAKTKPFFFRRVADHLRAQEAHRLDAASLQGLIFEEITLTRHFIAFARRQCSDPETERRKGVWDIAVFGFGGALRFTETSQPWLREATKVMAYNDLPLHRGQGAKQYCQSRISYLALLSQSLRLQRSDESRDPSSLTAPTSPLLEQNGVPAGRGAIHREEAYPRGEGGSLGRPLARVVGPPLNAITQTRARNNPLHGAHAGRGFVIRSAEELLPSGAPVS
ncbi:hypothetical protein [Nocardia sp. NPDC005745]|uniref:hypothetical protein n=1 Tax=Nocardia sp. NPDC005745 TaxID=3157061 RepID=UPI0033F5C66D